MAVKKTVQEEKTSRLYDEVFLCYKLKKYFKAFFHILL
nr:MAG TPA: hypothetical protein [Caudoviricetes sp.]